MTLKVITGYKLYPSSTWSSPTVWGYSGDEFMEWTILEGAVGAIAGLSASAITLATVILHL